MGKFVSINYTRVVCKECGTATVIEPGRVFSELNCNCKTVEEPSQEASTPYLEITEYKVGDDIVELLGVFANGDKEVKHVDGTLSYRIPKDTFDKDYKEVEDEAFTLSIDELKGKTADEIKAAYNMDELRLLAKVLKVRGSSQMNEDKLVGKLLEKAK